MFQSVFENKRMRLSSILMNIKWMSIHNGTNESKKTGESERDECCLVETRGYRQPND